MSSKLRWMPDWLTGPSLGQYLKVRPGDNTQPAQAAPAATQEEGEGLGSTKQLLKEQMVDSFFERALHQIEPESPDALDITDVVSDGAPPAIESLVEGVSHEPIFEVAEPLDDLVQVAEQDSYGDEVPGAHLPPDIVEEAYEEHTVDVVEPSKVGYYIFAITLGQYDFQLPDLSIDADYPLFVFPFGDAQAVISEVPLDVYSEEALQSKLNDPAWFEQTLRQHTKILSRVQAQVSIVPMRVCTICDSMEGLKAFLGEHHEDFVSTLQLIEGNHSWRFSIFCNEPRLRTLTAKASNRVRAIQAEMAGKSRVAGQPLHEKLEGVLEEEARSVCKACVKHSHGTLSVVSSRNMVQSFTEHEAGEAGKREIFRCDYLVSTGQREAFEKEIASLIEAYKSLGFELEVAGPHAAAQFASRKVLAAGKLKKNKPTAPVAAG